MIGTAAEWRAGMFIKQEQTASLRLNSCRTAHRAVRSGLFNNFLDSAKGPAPCALVNVQCQSMQRNILVIEHSQ
jgi:hypothetical protein